MHHDYHDSSITCHGTLAVLQVSSDHHDVLHLGSEESVGRSLVLKFAKGPQCCALLGCGIWRPHRATRAPARHGLQQWSGAMGNYRSVITALRHTAERAWGGGDALGMSASALPAVRHAAAWLAQAPRAQLASHGTSRARRLGHFASQPRSDAAIGHVTRGTQGTPHTQSQCHMPTPVYSPCVWPRTRPAWPASGHAQGQSGLPFGVAVWRAVRRAVRANTRRPCVPTCDWARTAE